MKKSLCCVASALVLGLISLEVIQKSALAQTWNGPTFKEFAGVNQGSSSNTLNSILGWDRSGFDFSTAEPTEGAWNQSYVGAYQSNEAAYQQQGMTCLPFLGFMASWAGPNTYGPPSVESSWTDYVTQSVNDLHANPYNENYFQIWNEAYPSSSGYAVATPSATFWKDNFNNYMNDIHFPAASVIHNAGAKVVWGGWPGGPVSPQDFINMMNHYSAWNSIDVVDLHYFHWSDLNTIRNAAISGGYPNLGYWQTENGFTTDPLYIPSEYPQALYWGLTSGVWNAQDKFKYFYFANWAPSDPAAYGYLCSLWNGGNLNFHGLILQNMAALLGGGILDALPGVTGTGVSSNSYITGYQVGAGKDIIAVGLNSSDYHAHTSTTLTFPVPLSQIVKAERVDLDGSNVVNLTSSLAANGANTNLTVSTRDASGSNAQTWNSAVSGYDKALFYVRLTLNTTPSLRPFGGTAAVIPGTVQAENYDTGGQGIGYSMTVASGSANGYRTDGIDIEACSDAGGGYDIGWASPGQWLRYTANVTTPGNYSAAFRVSNGTTVNGCFHVMNSSGANVTGSVTVPPTGGYQNWTTVSAAVSLPAGPQVLTLVQDTAGYNINSTTFTPLPPSAPAGLSAAAGVTQVALSWTNSPGATSYNVYRGTSSGLENPEPIATGITTPAYTDGSVTNGTPYFYTVAAVNPEGASGYSNEAGATPMAEVPYGGAGAAVPGTIYAVNYDSGGQGIGYNVTSINGTDNGYRPDGVDISTSTDAGVGYNIGWTSAGQWFRYTVNVAAAGTYNVAFRVANGTPYYGYFHLQNSSGANLTGSVIVPPTAGWETWTMVNAFATLPAGQQILTLYQDTSGFNINSMSLVLPSATDVSSQVTVTRGGFRYNFATRLYGQSITLTNTGAAAVTGPISLVLNSLSANAGLANASGTTNAVLAVGRPYINTASLAAGASVSIPLQFTDTNVEQSITYTTQVLAGSGTR